MRPRPPAEGVRRASDEDEREDPAQQPVEDDRLAECEAEPHDALQLATQLRLARDRLDHRAEDVADADAGPDRAESDTECQGNCLALIRDVTGCFEEKKLHVASLMLRLDRRA